MPEVLDDPNGSYGPVVSMPDNGVEALDEEERPPEEAADTTGMTLSTNLFNTVFAYCYTYSQSAMPWNQTMRRMTASLFFLYSSLDDPKRKLKGDF